MVINGTLVALVITLLIVLYLISKIQTSNNRNKLSKCFENLCLLVVVYLIGLILQIMFSNTSIKPIYFDYITYIAIVLIPVSLFEISQEYKGGKKIDVRFLYIVPIISLLVLWTSDWHKLFYVEYSTVISEVKYGYYFYIHMIYTYGLLVIDFINIVVASIKKSGFLSSQTVLILLGELAPLLPNALGTLKVISMSIYITPMMFAVTAVCFYIAIIHLKALNVIPVTLKAIVDNMSDAFVVISEDGTIADLNKTFIEKFNEFGNVKDKANLFEVIKRKNILDLEQIKKDKEEAKQKETTITKEYHIEKDDYDKYFEVDFQPVKSKDGTEYVATLLLLRDVTTAKRDMEIMLKNESLVMLGELAGGVAHDINTPISAIKSGLLMFKTIAKSDDEKMLVERMDSCADKIVTLTNSLRNQIRNIGSNEVSDVNITMVVKDVAVIIHNELTKNRVKLNLDIKKDLVVKGNSAKLSQVVTNIIVNAVQAYENKGGEVNVKVDKIDNSAVISIQDFAGGIPEHIRNNIGKNILTTKGVSGTGFGLYLAYSVITGAFGGEIIFDSEVGKGTTFYIKIPM